MQITMQSHKVAANCIGNSSVRCRVYGYCADCSISVVDGIEAKLACQPMNDGRRIQKHFFAASHNHARLRCGAMCVFACTVCVNRCVRPVAAINTLILEQRRR